MFKRNKTNNKAKLEHKLYLARENPEPIFDLSDCGITQVPGGIYSLCRVFLKESLLLDHNKLTSLSSGGSLQDLSGLKILNLSFNSFSVLPDDISVLSNLKELYVNNNNLKKIPNTIGSLKNLRLLNISNNNLRNLPTEIGDLPNLRQLIITGNAHLNHLPHSICRASNLNLISVDFTNFIYPPESVVQHGTESIMRYICHDSGINYEPPCNSSFDDIDSGQQSEDISVKEKFLDFEKQKQERLQHVLQIEKQYELYQRQELELQVALKASRQKFLTDITEQQNKLEAELLKIQQKKEQERCKLIHELQEEEQKTDVAITNLLNAMEQPLLQLLEQEKLEEERLLAAAAKHNCNLRRNDVLEAMQNLLNEETHKFKQYDQYREETTQSILSQELLTDSHLAEILHNQGEQQAMLVSQLQKDMELQRAAVGTLLERGDARSWSLIQQVHLVETQLAKLTAIEIDRKKLEVDEHLNELAEKRANLSMMLVDLLEQQSVRRGQLLSTLQNMENLGQSQEDFWLLQYQQLLDRRPANISEVQKNLDLEFAQELLLSGMIHYLPLLAVWAQGTTADSVLTQDQLIDAGIKNAEDRKLILEAFKRYRKLQSDVKTIPTPVLEVPSGPSISPEVEEASAPEMERSTSITAAECVVCMDAECEVIFVPCGHMCCCANCTTPIVECPLCRGSIERKIKVILP